MINYLYNNTIKLINNATLMTFFSTFSRVGIGIAVLPLIIFKFDSYEVSLWLYLTTLLSFISLASFGFGQSTVRSINYFLSGYNVIPQSINQFNIKSEKLKHSIKINKDGIGDILFLTARVYNFLSIFAIFLISTLGTIVSWNIMSLGNHLFENWVSFGLVGIIAVLRIRFSRSVSIIEGFNFVAKIRSLESLFGLSKIILFTVLILLDFRIVHLLLVELFLQFFINLYSNRIIKSILLKDGIILSKIFNLEMFNQIWPSTWRYGLMLFGSHFINNGTVLVVAQLSDTLIISSYLLTVRILTIIRALSISQFNANYPSLIKLVVSKNFFIVKKTITPIIQNAMLALTICLVAIFFIGNDVLNFLSKDINIIDNYLFIIMSLGLLLEAHHGFHANIYLSTNHVPFLWPGLLSGIFIILVSLILIEPLGILGVVLSQFFIQLAFNNWFPVYLNIRLLKWNFSDYTLNILNLRKI
ncbi:hypothetical protein N8720_04105 [Candidatus Marinimicrobia bacterium]|jgi:hypothetical protein|nr:hypothetical protein [Candidatus Neomarinimicrobiota bacterium]